MDYKWVYFCFGVMILIFSFFLIKQKVKEEGEEEVKLVEGDDKKGVMHRARVVNEIVNTEKQYVENLLVIVKVSEQQKIDIIII